MEELIGSGTYGQVYIGRHIHTGDKVAVKCMKKTKVEKESRRIRLENEIRIQDNLNHKNIAKLYGVYESEKSIFLVMEYVEGRELEDYVLNVDKLNEKEAKSIFH